MKFNISDRIKIIGHRGSAKPYPENSLEAISHGIKSGAEMIEIDLRLTKDNEVALSHDENLKRMTGIDQNISEVTWEELLQLPIQNKKQIFYCARLKDVLKKVPKKIQFYLELKAAKYPCCPEQDKKLADKVIEVIKKEKKKKDSIIMSFNEKIILYVKRKYPSYSAGIIIKTEDQINYFLEKRSLKLDCLAVGHSALTKRSLNVIKTSEIPFIVWIVNSKRLWQKVASHNPVGIVTDYPDKFSDYTEKS